ncbi:MAG: ATP synthase subunit I [Terracidiphilus sp.]
MTTEATPPILNLDEEALDALLKRAFRNTALLGLVPAAVLLFTSGWRTAAMLLTGALISAASLLEWRRLAQLINDRLKKRKAQRGAVAVVAFFLLRLLFFAGAIYGSLKCLRGSPIALLCGLSLAVVTLTWEAIRLLRD